MVRPAEWWGCGGHWWPPCPAAWGGGKGDQGSPGWPLLPPQALLRGGGVQTRVRPRVEGELVGGRWGWEATALNSKGPVVVKEDKGFGG